MEVNLTFEEQVLSSHDWVQKTQAAVPERVVQDDYDNGIQELYITYSDGRRVFQKREWVCGGQEGNTIDDYYKFTEQTPAPSQTEKMAFIEANSTVVEEEELPPAETTGAGSYETDEDGDSVTVVSLESIEVLSMEVRHELFKKLTDGLGLFGKLGQAFSQFMDRRRVARELDFDTNAFERFCAKVGTHPFAELIDLRFFTPPGMRTTYLSLFQTLVECQEFSERTLNDTLVPLKQWAALMYNDPSRLRSVRTSSPVTVIDPTKLSKQLSAQCSFSGVAQRPFGDVFESNADFGKVNELVNDLVVRYNSTTINRFDDETKALSQILVQLTDTVGRMGDDKVSSEVATYLADLCYQVARQVEFYAVYQTVFRAALSALTQSRQHWDKHILR